MITAKRIIDKAQGEVGVCESPANSNNVKYNTWFYGHEVSGASYPWCAVFISWVFNGTGLCPKTASCAQMLEWFEAHSQITKSPQAGDIVFFRYSMNNRRTNHVGLVVDVKGNVITTIEGNTSKNSNDNGGRVMRRKRSSKIVGYARPAYEGATIARKTVRMGSKGEDVKYLQQKLASYGYHVGGADGIFGVNTCNAVIEFQSDHGLVADGVVGIKTWEKIESIG